MCGDGVFWDRVQLLLRELQRVWRVSNVRELQHQLHQQPMLEPMLGMR
jgi:hypothetical protein